MSLEGSKTKFYRYFPSSPLVDSGRNSIRLWRLEGSHSHGGNGGSGGSPSMGNNVGFEQRVFTTAVRLSNGLIHSIQGNTKDRTECNVIKAHPAQSRWE